LLGGFEAEKAAAAAGAPLRVEGFSSLFSVGFDSFSEKFSIDDADTLDLLNEFRSSVGLAYRHAFGGDGGDRSASEGTAAPPPSRLRLEDVLTFSDAAVRNRWNADLELVSGRGDRLLLASELSSRQIHQGGDLSSSSDYIQEVARAQVRARLTGPFSLFLRDRFEVIDFAQEDAYEMDYRRNEAGVGFAVESGLDSALEMTFLRGDRVVPDSSAIDYSEHALRMVWWQGLGLRSRIEAQADIGRRRYEDESVRPGYVLFAGQGRLAVGVGERFEVRLREELEATSYAAPSQVYFDQWLELAGIELMAAVAPGLELGVEPRVSLLRAEEGSGEDYDEWSGVLLADWLRIGRFWLAASVEAGNRDYRKQAVASEDTLGGAGSIFSDYSFVRTNVFGNLELGRRTTWSLHFSHEPERHALEGDDVTTSLFSTELVVRF
jgi:hypothetical protein